MNFEQLQLLIKELPCGKLTPQAIYIHKSSLKNEQLISFLSRIQFALKQEDYHWNIAKFWKNDFKFSLLSYPDFEEDSYPPVSGLLSPQLI